MLLCDKIMFYVGSTNDLPNRLKQHKNKQSFFTKKFNDLKLVYCEKYPTKAEVIRREMQIKGWRKEKKQMLIDGKLGINACPEVIEEACTEIVEVLSDEDNRKVSLP